MDKKKFDLIVIGAGPGGYPAAIRAAQHGKSVALIEAKQIGGTCLNRGCIPSKALIAGAELFEKMKHNSFGISCKNLAIDYAGLSDHKDRVVNKMRAGLKSLIEANKITLIHGFAEFISPKEIKIKGAESLIIQGDKIILATGSEPRSIPAFPFDYERIHDSTSLLEIKTLPQSLIVVGGGVIGCEFASLFTSLGVDVTIIELLPRILSTEAEEVSSALTRAFIKRGIKIETGVAVKSVTKTEQGIEAELENGKKISADICVVSVGRSLNTTSLGLAHAGLAVLPNGMISVNEKMETQVDGIYAIGDIASKWWLAHVASHQGIVAADNACGFEASMNYNAIPSVIFTHPEVASVGLSLDSALKLGYPAKSASFPFQALGKAQAIDESEGFAQLIVDEKTGQVYGAQVVGYDASTLIASMAQAITNELTVECITETIHPHPTFGEVWLETAFVAENYPLHIPPRVMKKQK